MGNLNAWTEPARFMDTLETSLRECRKRPSNPWKKVNGIVERAGESTASEQLCHKAIDISYRRKPTRHHSINGFLEVPTIVIPRVCKAL
jgi:hypothetical protein